MTEKAETYELKNLNILSPGIDKHWIYGSKTNYMLSCDYLQKMNISIQDFNYFINQDLTREKLCYLILLVVWIKDSYYALQDLLPKEIVTEFSKREQIKYKTRDAYSTKVVKATEYINALRSFVLAHPLKTDKHSKFGLNGNYICLDISFPKQERLLRTLNITREKSKELSINGLVAPNSFESYDYCLFVYSKKSGAEFYEYFLCNLVDLYSSASEFINKTYRLSKFLNRYKRSRK